MHVCVCACDASLPGSAVIEAGWTSGLKVAAALQAVMYKTHTHTHTHTRIHTHPWGTDRVVFFFVLLHYILNLSITFFPQIFLRSFTMLSLFFPSSSFQLFISLHFHIPLYPLILSCFYSCLSLFPLRSPVIWQSCFSARSRIKCCFSCSDKLNSSYYHYLTN